MTKVEAEMAGQVWKILVEVGSQVEKNASIMILESMKMEIPVTAGTTGTVVEIHVAENDAVSAGQLLAVVTG